MSDYVCLNTAGRYCSMLLEEGGLQHLEAVRSHPETHGDVCRLADSILDSLHRHSTRTGCTGPPKAQQTHRGMYLIPINKQDYFIALSFYIQYCVNLDATCNEIYMKV